MMRCGQVTGDIIYNNDGLIYICIYVSPSLNLLTVKILISGILAHWGLVTHVYVPEVESSLDKEMAFHFLVTIT